MTLDHSQDLCLVAINWMSYKQNIVMDVITESKCIALSDATKEVILIKKFNTKLGVISNKVTL